LIQAGVLRWLDQFDVCRAIDADGKSRHRDRLVGVLTQIVGEYRQRLKDRVRSTIAWRSRIDV